MPKQGPCCHCGTTSTPLWRNGPPGKPVLCNACGSRWRTKGTLANYVPLQTRRVFLGGSEIKRNFHGHKLSTKKPKWLITASQNDSDIECGETASVNESSAIVFEDDTSNRSSSGSRLSFSESTVLLGSSDGNDISGSVQSDFWEAHNHSFKRTIDRCQSPSPVEKLQQDLFNILQEEGSTNHSAHPEEVLLFQREDQMLSVETKLGSVLIKHPTSLSEEKSESNSFVKGTQLDTFHDNPLETSAFFMPSQNCEISSSHKSRKVFEIEGEEMAEPPLKRCALADISSKNIHASYVDVQESSHSAKRSTCLMSTKSQDFKSEKETLSCSLPTRKQNSQLLGHTSRATPNEGMKTKSFCSSSHQLRKAKCSTNIAFRKGPTPSESVVKRQIVQHTTANVSASSVDKSSAVLNVAEEDPSSSAASWTHPSERLICDSSSSRKEHIQ